MTSQELEYLIKVNDRDLRELKGRVRDTNKALGDETHDAATKGSAGLSRIGKAAGVAALALGTGAAVGLGFAAKAGFDEFRQGQAVAAQTAAVLKSTGGSAHVTAGHVEELGAALLRKSGVDDEVIKSGENLLLTFTGIRNEAGKGNDIFDQATKTMLDMSVALGQDTKSSAIQLGKALNDPIKGITALQRVGVSFTEGQKEQIKTLVEHGHTLEAQKLILGELTKEFGGSAAAAGSTFSGQLNVAKETLRNFAGEIVGAAMPAIAELVVWFNGHALPAITEFARKLSTEARPILRAVGEVISTYVIPILRELGQIFTASVQRIAAVLREHKPELEQIWRNLRTLIAAVGEVVQTVLIPILRFAFEKVLPKLLDIALPILAALSNQWRVVAAVIRTAVAVIEDVVSAFVAVKNFAEGGLGKAKSLIVGAFNAIAGPIRTVAHALADVVNFLEQIIGLAGKAAGALGKIGDVAGKIGGVVHKIPGLATGITNFGGGVALVGENGPELVNLPRGSDVITSDRTRELLGSRQGGGGLVVVERMEVQSPLDAELVAGALARKLTTLAPA